MPIDREDVVAGYRALLRREPESDDAIDQHARAANSLADFLREIVGSEEYRRLTNPASEAFWNPGQEIDVFVPVDTLDRLMMRTQRQWKKLGEEEPYWSVVVTERFRKARMNAETTKEILDSGATSANLIGHFESRTKTVLPRGSCFELGCGVGRVTYWLAKMFDKVVAADISPGNIALCRENLESRGVFNVEYMLVDRLSDYDEVAPFDVLFSVIVLQHNTPPIQRLILEKLLSRTSPRGGCLFQLPVYIPNYAFNADRHLATEDEEIDMHALPMHAVLQELSRSGLRILDVVTDHWTGMPGSYTFFAAR